MTSQRSRTLTQSKWSLPAFSLVLGAAVLVAGLIGRQPVVGVAGLIIMAAFGLIVLLAGSRSETVRGLRGDGRDERFAMMDLRATALAGLTVTIALIVAWLVAIARGHTGSPYDWLCAIGGVAYLIALGLLRWRG